MQMHLALHNLTGRWDVFNAPLCLGIGSNLLKCLELPLTEAVKKGRKLSGITCIYSVYKFGFIKALLSREPG